MRPQPGGVQHLPAAPVLPVWCRRGRTGSGAAATPVRGRAQLPAAVTPTLCSTGSGGGKQKCHAVVQGGELLFLTFISSAWGSVRAELRADGSRQAPPAGAAPRLGPGRARGECPAPSRLCPLRAHPGSCPHVPRCPVQSRVDHAQGAGRSVLRSLCCQSPASLAWCPIPAPRAQILCSTPLVVPQGSSWWPSRVQATSRATTMG